MATETVQRDVVLKENDAISFVVDKAGGKVFQDEKGRTMITAEVAPDWQILASAERVDELEAAEAADS